MDEMSEKVEQKEPSLADALAAEFDKQTQEPVIEEDKEEPVEAEAAPEETEKSEQAEEKVEVVPPEHWSEEDKNAFMQMDESGRDWALRLEANAHKGIEEKSKELKRFRDAFEPYKHLVPPGVSEEQVIQNLLNAQNVLNSNPVEGIRWLMRSYGIDEKQFMPTSVEPDEDDEYLDPEVRKLREEIATLKNSAQQNLLLAEQRRQQELMAQINEFRDAVDDKGEPLHPHYGEVIGVMAGLLQSGRATDMESAYEQAVWAVPEYRDHVVEQQAKERAEAELKAKTEAATKAAKASKSVNGQSSSKSPSAPKSIGDALTEAYEKSIRGEL